MQIDDANLQAHMRVKCTFKFFLRCALLIGSVACTFARTQTVVEVHTDARVMNEADEVRIEVRSGTGAVILERVVAIRTSDFRGFPLELPVSAKTATTAAALRYALPRPYKEEMAPT